MRQATRHARPPHNHTTVAAAAGLLALLMGLGGCATPPANTVGLNRAAPEGWALAGRDVAVYRVDVDARELRREIPSATLLSTQAGDEQFALLEQHVDATPYRNARVRFSGYLKTVDVLRRSFLWLRVDGESSLALAFDDLHRRPVRGTTRWEVYEILLDVPADATEIRMGAGLIGSGQIWLNDCLLEIVEEPLPTTDRRLPPLERAANAETIFWEAALDLPPVSASSDGS